MAPLGPALLRTGPPLMAELGGWHAARAAGLLDPYRGTVYRPTGRLRGHRAGLRPPLATHDPYRGTVVRLRWRLRGHRTALRPPLATHGPHRFPYLGPPGATAKSVAIISERRLGS